MAPKQAAYQTIKKVLEEEYQRRRRYWKENSRELASQLRPVDDALKALELLKPEAASGDHATLF